jgi:hypothetical protein
MDRESKTRIAELEKQGWVRQFIASEPRLSEAVELYEQSGFEVHLEPLPKIQECETCEDPEREGQGKCRVCFDGFEDRYRIIFTRSSKNSEEDASF